MRTPLLRNKVFSWLELAQLRRRTQAEFLKPFKVKYSEIRGWLVYQNRVRNYLRDQGHDIREVELQRLNELVYLVLEEAMKEAKIKGKKLIRINLNEKPSSQGKRAGGDLDAQKKL